ncbi:MAG: hypothetical protein ACSLFK_05840 [Gemmatimonadaceae bacterium]
MRPEIRRTVVPVAIMALASMACQSDVKPVGDILAHDSTLALEVYGARPDSVDIVEADVPLFDTAVVATSVSPEETAPARASPTVEATPSPARATSARRVASTSRKSQPRPIATTASNTKTRPVTTTRRTRTVAPAEIVPSRAWLVLPAGTRLELESERQICTNDGDSFVATLAEPVIRGGGTIVPAGSTARGEIVANDESDSGVAMRVQWLTFDGRAHAVKTRVTDVDTRRARERSSDGSRASCIPRGGRITAELTKPLRVLLSSR